jgi:alkylated DNA repair dioxygenase AlkB
MTIINNKELGLEIYENFVSDNEHSLLIKELESEFIKHIFTGTGYMDRSKVIRYGNISMCENNHAGVNFPENIDQLSNKLVDSGILNNKSDTININEYLKGDFIAPHIDRVASGPIVTILSLKSPAKMIFTSGKKTFDLILLPKMLIQMKNIIRWHWHHSISPVEDTRYSIVFRNKNE